MILFLECLFYLAVLYFLSVFLTSNMSCIGSAFDVHVSCIGNYDFNDFRSFLIFSNNSVVNVDVHVNVDNYDNDLIGNFMITIFNQNLRVIAIILNRRSCFQSSL